MVDFLKFFGSGDYQKADDKPKKSRRSLAPTATTASMVPASDTQVQSSEIMSPQFYDDTVIVLTAILDTYGRLVELILYRCVEIPRLLLKIIGFCLPYQTNFYKLTIRWGPLSTVGLYEISKYLTLCQLSEICLDDSPVAGRNYELLLGETTHLRSLSLARCKLDDDDTAKIANLLTHPKPAAKLLSILSLVSNRIGDRGASVLGQTLRSNRTLKYLNLAGNRITDVGASCILRSLMEFLVTQEEILAKRARFLEYLKMKYDVYKKCIKELNQDRNQDDSRMTRRRTVMRTRKTSITSGVSAADALLSRAENMTLELVGTYSDPFTTDCTTPREGQLYCIGNLCLTCLNLSYNNLHYATVEMLHDVLTYQSWISGKPGCGLLRINVEGNAMPQDCDEWGYIDELLERAQVAKPKLITKRPSEKIKARASRVI